MKTIKLGIKSGSGVGFAAPSRGIDEIYYPSVTLDDMNERFASLPREGTITFRFKRRRKEESEYDRGVKRYSCTLDLTAVTDIGTSGESDVGEFREDAVLRLKRESEDGN